MVATAVFCLRDRESREYLKKKALVALFVVIAVLIGWGVARGWWINGLVKMVSDANAYLYFAMLPAFMLAFRKRHDRARLIQTILGATTATAALTLLVFFLFTHATPEPILRAVYKWVRDYGLGEITRAPGGFYRVFFQAHIWNFIVCLMAPALIVRNWKGRRAWTLWLAGALSVAVLFVCFSRTLWLSAAIAGVVGLVLVSVLKTLRTHWWKYLTALAVICAIGLAWPFLLSRTVGGAALARAGSFGGEAAVDSRMNLLKVMWPAILEHPYLGSGFGKELTYVTRDPRLLAYFPDGNYTTSAFEWGWLDFWLKLGFLAPLAFLLLVVTIGRLAKDRLMAATDDGRSLALALLLALVGISIAHVASPWLNHPLGIGFLLLGYSILNASEPQDGTATRT